jgi:hypothetical protein
MTVLFDSAKVVKPYHFGCGLSERTILAIKGVPYAAEAIDAGECGTAAFRLCKLAGDFEVYDVVRTWYGEVTCDCADFEFRRRGTGLGPCKHGRACVDAGLMEAPHVGPPDRYPDEATELPESAYHEEGPEADVAAALRALPAITAPCCPADEAEPCIACSGAAESKVDPEGRRRFEEACQAGPDDSEWDAPFIEPADDGPDTPTFAASSYKPYTALDAAWWARVSNRDPRDYDGLIALSSGPRVADDEWTADRVAAYGAVEGLAAAWEIERRDAFAGHPASEA